MQIPRYVVGAAAFALIWAVITYTQHGWGLKKLAVGVGLFFVLASGLCWALTLLLTWLKKRR